MTDIDQLAAEYWTYYLDEQPTHAHLIGEYGGSGRFEDATRAHEDEQVARLRQFARRAGELDESRLGEQQRITRDVLVADATARADLTEQRLVEFAADPIFGDQIQMPILIGMLALPTADVADALVDKFRGLGRYYGELAE